MQKAVVILAVPLIGACTCCSGGVIWAVSPAGQQFSTHVDATNTAQAMADAQATATAAQYALLHPVPTEAPTQIPTGEATATAKPTAAATATPTPKPAPTATTPPPPPPPTATPVPMDCQAICNPWGYDFNPGNLITSPPSDFCNVFPCIPSFWNQTNGYVVECQDGDYSHSGGRSGVCSYHGGYKQTLYSH